jgi:uroporphyrinogen-III synthase
LRDVVAAHMPVERLVEGLKKVTILSRGPKPLPILREMNLRAQIVVPEPNTWKEIVETVAARPERRIAVQQYGRPNLEMNVALEQLGVSVTSVPIYRWELPADLEPLREAARRLAAREYDVVLFTSAIQLDHLWEVACRLGLEEEVRKALTAHVVIASVGPVMTAALESYGLSADIIPQHPKMGALIRAASEAAVGVLAVKRRVKE